MALRRRSKLALVVLGMVTALVVGGLTLLPPCGEWPQATPQVIGVGRARGTLRVGAAVVPLAPALPATIAGYGPLRHDATKIEGALEARATCIDVHGERVTLVQLDTLFVTARMQLAVATGFSGRVWLTASHTHTSFGGYDDRLVAQLAALGRYEAEREAQLVDAARKSVELAQASLSAAHLETAEATVDGLTFARSGGSVDQRLTILRFVGDRPIAQWVIFSAHPTIANAAAGSLDGDWPASLAQAYARDPGLITLVLQGAGGNASVAREHAPQASDLAREVRSRIDALTVVAAVEPVALSWVEVAFALPHPDASRLVPTLLTPVVERALCQGAEHDAMVSVLRLGSMALLFTTVEPSAAAGLVLEEQARSGRVVSLTNGYHGYLETAEAVNERTGEARRQYFGPQFAKVISDAARLAGDLTAPKQ